MSKVHKLLLAVGTHFSVCEFFYMSRTEADWTRRTKHNLQLQCFMRICVLQLLSSYTLLTLTTNVSWVQLRLPSRSTLHFTNLYVFLQT